MFCKRFSSHLQVLRLLWLSYRQTWFSLLMVGLSLLIACAGLSAVLLINQSAKQSYSGDTASLVLDASHQLVPADDNSAISMAHYAHIKQMGISEAVAVTTVRHSLYLDGNRLPDRIDLIGVDVLALLNQVVVRANNQALLGLEASNEQSRINNQIGQQLGFNQNLMLAHPRLLEERKILPQSTLSLDQSGLQLLPSIVSLPLNGLSDVLLLDIGVLLSIVPDARISRVLLPTTISQAKLERLREWLPAELILAPIDNQQNGAELTKSFHLNLFAMALLMFAVCLFIVMNACNLLMYKRFAMLKIMRQLGVGRLHILLTHAFEFVIFAIVISAIGVVLGAQIAMLVAPTIRGIIEGLYQVQIGFVDTAWLILYAKVLAISLAGITMALLVPFRQLNQSMAHTHSHSQPSDMQWWIASAMIILSTIALLIFSFSETLSILLVGAAAMILAGSCLLLIVFPNILMLCYRLLPNRFILLRLSLAQSLALSQKTKIACCAFFIAVTSNLGMNLMVDSFRASTEGWLSQRLVAEHYLYSDNPIANAKLADLARAHEVTLQPRFEKTSDLFGQNVQLFSYPTEELFKRAMVFEQKNLEAWEAFEAGHGVFINQQLAIRNGLSLNDTLNIQSPLTTQTRSLKIEGIIYDYGNPLGQVLMPPSQFSQDFTRASIFAVSGNALAVENFSASLTDIGIRADSQFFPSADILSGSMQVFDNTFIITDGLNLVTLVVAAISLACTLITLIDQGRPQTMLLRAIGISAWQCRGLLLAQYMLLCLVALVAATPFGLLLSYVLINQINYYAFNWSYPLVVEIFNIIQLYGISFLVVILVISIPIIVTSKQSLAQELTCLD